MVAAAAKAHLSAVLLLALGGSPPVAPFFHQCGLPRATTTQTAASSKHYYCSRRAGLPRRCRRRHDAPALASAARPRHAAVAAGASSAIDSSSGEQCTATPKLVHTAVLCLSLHFLLVAFELSVLLRGACACGRRPRLVVLNGSSVELGL